MFRRACPFLLAAAALLLGCRDRSAGKTGAPAADGARVDAAPARSAPVPRVARELVRCELPADLVTTCGGLEIAVDRGGLVYLADGQSVRRLRADVAAGCSLRLEPPGELALARAPRPASGFAAMEVNWHLVVGDGVPHGLDFTNGLWRLDGATPQPVCGALAGVRRLAFLDATHAVTDRADQRLLDLRTCKLAAQRLTPSPLDIVAADGVLFGIADGQVHRYASVTAPGMPIEEPPTDGRVPSAIAPCGRGVCVLDANTPAIERYARRGELVEVATYARDDRPMEGFAAAPDGAYWLVRRGPLPMPAGDTTFTYTNNLTCPIEVYRLGP